MKDVGKTWSLGGVYFICDRDSMDKPNLRYSEHAVLDSNQTVLMLYGKEHDTREVGGVLYTGLATLQAAVGSGWLELISDQGVQGNYYLEKLDIQTLYDVKQQIPAYRITINMRKQITISGAIVYWASNYWNGDYWSEDYW